MSCRGRGMSPEGCMHVCRTFEQAIKNSPYFLCSSDHIDDNLVSLLCLLACGAGGPWSEEVRIVLECTFLVYQANRIGNTRELNKNRVVCAESVKCIKVFVNLFGYCVEIACCT